MAEQLTELRRIDWPSWFPFLRIFKAFGLAVQPSKLGLALAGVLLMGIWGYLLDGVWRLSSARPVGPEVWAYWQAPDIGEWREAQIRDRAVALQAVYRDGVLAGQGPKDLRELREPGALEDALKKIKKQYRAEAEGYKKAPASAAAAVVGRYAPAYETLAPFRTRGVFASFLEYEQEVIGHFIDQATNLLTLDFASVTRGADEVFTARRMGGELRRPGDFGEIGMIGSVLLMVRGLQWLLFEHWVFAPIFLLGTLAIWSIFGGAVCRMSALNAAHDEQIAPKAALAFSVRKFFAFFTTPLVPLGLIVVLAVLLMVGGLVTSIPYLGEIIGPPFLALGLLAGGIMAVLVVGLLFGGGLLWPVIGVEGSDGFDAISRSWAYMAARPWRFAFYSIVAAVYGAVTYVALKYFAYFTLYLTRFWLGAGAGCTERPGTGLVEGTKVDAMWPAPLPHNLMGDGSPLFGTIHWESFGAVIIGIWVLLFVLLLCAYLVSFYFSASTLIYLLLRQQVDATDFEDVYVEDEEETAPVVPSTVASAAPSAGGSETPPPAAPPEATPPAAEPPPA